MKLRTWHRSRGMLAASLCLVAAAWAGEASAQAAGQWRDATHAYSKICGHCHDTGIGPVITGRDLQPEYYMHVVRNGFRAMPAFRPTDIDDKTLAALAETLAKAPPPKSGGKP